MKYSSKELLIIGQDVISIEIAELMKVKNSLDVNFCKSIKLIANRKGKVIVSGVGKSGIIAQKISATLNSTGTVALFLHPTDALHGDIGTVHKDDIVILLSKSGNTHELKDFVTALKKINVKIIAITSSKKNYLKSNSDLTIEVDIEKEACVLDLAPTSSTTAMLAIGDALCVALYKENGFTISDFALTHPAGDLGKKLLLKISDVMRKNNDIPIVQTNSTFKEVIIEISKKRIGATLVLKNKLIGIITDGDLRRFFEKDLTIEDIVAEDVMTINPLTIKHDVLCIAGLELMELHKRTHLPVTDSNGKLIGIIHIHDLIDLGF